MSSLFSYQSSCRASISMRTKNAPLYFVLLTVRRIRPGAEAIAGPKPSSSPHSLARVCMYVCLSTSSRWLLSAIAELRMGKSQLPPCTTCVQHRHQKGGGYSEELTCLASSLSRLYRPSVIPDEGIHTYIHTSRT